jgi:hypothetical protein
MATAIDPKRPKQNLGQHPRLARTRKKPAPVTTLGDDAAQVMLFYGLSERDYRVWLFADFCRFCRLHDGWVTSPPNQGTARVQLAEGSALLEKLPPRYPVATLPGISHRLTHGRFTPVREIEVLLWR